MYDGAFDLPLSAFPMQHQISTHHDIYPQTFLLVHTAPFCNTVLELVLRSGLTVLKTGSSWSKSCPSIGPTYEKPKSSKNVPVHQLVLLSNL